MAVFRIEKKTNYTIMSNVHLRDKTISLKAKGLLSFMLSLPESWNYTLAGLATQNLESIDAIRSGIRELEKAGYVVRYRVRNERGQLKGTEYVVREIPVQPEDRDSAPIIEEGAPPSKETLAPITQNYTKTPTKGDSFIEPTPPSPPCHPPSREMPIKGAARQISKDRTTKDSQKTKQEIKENAQASMYPSTNVIPSVSPSEGKTERKSSSVQAIRENIRKQIDYPILAHNFKTSRKTIDELVEIMVEVGCGKQENINIGKGVSYPAELVKERMSAIDSTHIQKILEGIAENTTRVKNTKAYLLAALFNAPATIDTHYRMLVNHDLGGIAV